KVSLITRRFELKLAFLVTTQCAMCTVHLFPNHIMRRNEAHGQFQVLECETEYLHVSRKGVWVHCTLAHLQEMAMMQFHTSWLGFCGFVNHVIGRGESSVHRPWITCDERCVAGEEMQKMYVEHFACRLLMTHSMWATFQHEVAHCAHPGTSQVVQPGVSGGTKEHTCQECTHRKTYFSDFEDPDALAAAGVASMADDHDGALPAVCPLHTPWPFGVTGEGILQNARASADDMPEEGIHLSRTRLPVQADPGPGATCGWVHMAVMDSKTMVHRICTVKDCQGALVNYRHGRFCEAHITLARICGVDGCEVACVHKEAMTCDNAAHIRVYHRWCGQFSRESFLGVHRGLHTHHGTQADKGLPREGAPAPGQVQPQGVEVPPGDPVANLDLGHTFQARHIYCLQTLQWACGVPIGFGKCCGSESTPQVHSFISAMFPIPSSHPAFMCYDNACSLLRHMARQNIDEPWLDSIYFIVDAWHYINHQPANLLCWTCCNPSPRNGPQPYLLFQTTDPTTGHTQMARAFNAEAAEQLNGWLDGFEAQLRQMSDFNYGFTVQVALMLYKEKRGRQMASKGLTL
ncbi:hypothetical protein JB92DRAFT_2600530, partial [Gautieria morchelliformis]